MPLRIVVAADVQTLWARCADQFLDEVGDNVGPAEFEAHLWLTHRNLRDQLFERARRRGRCGWLGRPFSFFSELPQRFAIHARPAGLLTRRRLLSRLAARVGREVMRREPGHADGVIRGHMLDSLFSELLPEGVTPERLRAGLEQLGGDAFARRRNRWIATVYERYLRDLAALGVYDERSIHALIAAEIDGGRLADAVLGATTLHVYGLYGPRHRHRLFEALAAQAHVETVLYAIREQEPNELEALAYRVETVAAARRSRARVQPAPDSAREAEWVAEQVKRTLLADDIRPWQVAVVARSGQDDTRRIQAALVRAGVPTTARVRTPMSEIAALKALQSLFRGAAANWNYRSLRAVLAHPYFEAGVDLRAIDYIAGLRRVQGLQAWDQALRELRSLLQQDGAERVFRGTRIFADRVDRDIEAFARLRSLLEPLAVERPEREWLDASLALLRDDFLGFRRRICEPAAGYWDVVRLDQRGLLQLERLLHEWQQLDHAAEPMNAGRWQTLLARLLAANELVLTTPLHKGVQVLEAHDAALIPFRALFVVHANDGEFPRAPATATILSDDESRRLGELGVRLPTREQRLRRERGLWAAVVSQHDEVAISYRTTTAGGTPLLPSMLVPSHDPADELPRTRVPWLRSAAEIEPVTRSNADRLAVQALAEAVRGRKTGTVLLRPARPAFVEHALVAGIAEANRHRAGTILREDHPGLEPNPWNGELRDPAVLARLAQRFDAEYRWSASALEAYAKCPFAFLLDRVLRIGETDEVDEETSPLKFGAVAHDILERFYAAHLESLPSALTAAAEAELGVIADEVFARAEREGEWLGLPLLWASTREQIASAIRAYLDWELPLLEKSGAHPVHVERRFGYDDETVTLQGKDVRGVPAELRVIGRIDRVDRSGKRKTVHDVVDYKSNYTPPKGGYADGSNLQTAIYLRVLEDRGEPARKARYRSIKKAANAAEITAGDADYRAALAFAFSIPGRVRGGLFEPVKSYWSGDWQPWDLGPEITRGRARLAKGRSRFDG